jgi:uncharacterized protein (DUF433 family)
MSTAINNQPRILAFSQDQVNRLTGLSVRQLQYWDRTGLFVPELAMHDRRRPHSRIYSYRDVVGLRTLALLRNAHGVSLQSLREVNAWLNRNYDRPWSQLTFWVRGTHVFFDDGKIGARISGRTGQVALPIAMAKIVQETDEAVAQLGARGPEEVGHIEHNRHIQRGAWVVAGTRVPTWIIDELHQDGETLEGILARFPSLTEADVQAALAHEQSQGSKQRAS